MEWNFQDIGFLYRPDVYTGSFDNPIMQARHEELKRQKLDALRKGSPGDAGSPGCDDETA